MVFTAGTALTVAAFATKKRSDFGALRDGAVAGEAYPGRFLSAFAVGMGPFVDLPQLFDAHMGVNGGGLELFMAEHLLHELRWPVSRSQERHDLE